MFAGLRFNSFIRRDDQNNGVDSTGPGEHVFDKPLVPGYVDNSDVLLVREEQMSKSEFDRNAALLFFSKTIRIDARECANERRLAVIDVTGSADDDSTRAVH